MKWKLFHPCWCVCFILCSCNSGNQDISGEWKWEYINELGQEHQTELMLKTKDSLLYTGYYCSVYNSGSKVDCYNKDTKMSLELTRDYRNHFKGKLTPNVPNNSTDGIIEIDYSPNHNSLFVNILKEPDGDFLFPDEVTFKRN